MLIEYLGFTLQPSQQSMRVMSIVAAGLGAADAAAWLCMVEEFGPADRSSFAHALQAVILLLSL